MKIYHDPSYARRRFNYQEPAALHVIWPGGPRQHAHLVRSMYRRLRATMPEAIARWFVYDLLKCSVRFDLDGETWNGDYDRLARLHNV